MKRINPHRNTAPVHGVLPTGAGAYRKLTIQNQPYIEPYIEIVCDSAQTECPKVGTLGHRCTLKLSLRRSGKTVWSLPRYGRVVYPAIAATSWSIHGSNTRKVLQHQR